MCLKQKWGKKFNTRTTTKTPLILFKPAKQLLLIVPCMAEHQERKKEM